MKLVMIDSLDEMLKLIKFFKKEVSTIDYPARVVCYIDSALSTSMTFRIDLGNCFSIFYNVYFYRDYSSKNVEDEWSVQQKVGRPEPTADPRIFEHHLVAWRFKGDAGFVAREIGKLLRKELLKIRMSEV